MWSFICEHSAYDTQNDGHACYHQSIAGNYLESTQYTSGDLSFQEIVDEIDEDGSGELEFPEFIQLAAKFLIEEDEEQMKWELREAFRIYDKQGKNT